MSGYKMLWVEDELKKSMPRFRGLFSSYLDDVDGEALRSADRNEGIIELLAGHLPFLEIATNVVEAIQKVKYHADEYLLFIIDRNLGSIKETDKKEELPELWPSLDSSRLKDGALMAGDLVLEYLCLEKGMIQTTKDRFHFLTSNETQADDLKKFLRALHFSDDCISNMIIGKGTGEDTSYKELKRKVQHPAAFHIQTKYKEVFTALGARVDDLGIDEPEHVQNLIKALAYVEGVKLEGQKLEPPLLGLLRQMVEAFAGAIEAKCKDGSFQERDVANWDKTSFDLDIAMSILKKYWYWNSGFCTDNLKVENLFGVEVPARKNSSYTKKDLAEKFFREYRDVGYCLMMTKNLLHQEIHHNPRRWCEGKRLELIVYGVCELLRFYHEHISKNEPIELSKADIKRAEVFDLLESMDLDADGWNNLRERLSE